MKDTKFVKSGIAVTLLTTVFLGSCSLGLSPDTSSPEEDLVELDQALSITANSAVAAAEAQLQASDEIGASTTYNFDSSVNPVTVAAGETETLETRSDFPYPGWSTNGTVENIANPGVYSADWDNPISGNTRLLKVTSTASPDEAGVYPESEVREVYYVVSSDDVYDESDSIHAPYTWAGTGYRDEYIADYSDGSTRNHWILADGTTYTAFDIDGSLDFETVNSGSVASEGSAEYSSATMYTHELGRTFNYWFWNNNDDITPYILGVRYYTEHLVGDEYVGTSLTVEYTYDSEWRTSDETPLLLARTIIREEMRFAHDDQNNDGTLDSGEVGAATGHTLRLRTEVNNTSGGEGLIYTRQGKNLTDWNSRGNAREAQLAGVQRDTLPANYGNIAEFSTTLDNLDGGTE